jgi:hypothetical protein
MSGNQLSTGTGALVGDQCGLPAVRAFVSARLTVGRSGQTMHARTIRGDGAE